jgi:hypothetical protein
VGEPADPAHVTVQTDDEIAGADGVQRHLHTGPPLTDDDDLGRPWPVLDPGMPSPGQRTVGARCPERCTGHPRPFSMCRLPCVVTVGDHAVVNRSFG